MPAIFAPKILPARVAVVLFAFLASNPIHAAPKAEKPGMPKPSIGQDVTARVERGGSVEILLKGVAMPGDSVQFAVLAPPAQGSLSGPRRIASDSVLYTYHHDNSKEHWSDRAVFKLKTAPGNAWGRITASIEIQEPQSRLFVDPETLDFGPVPIGQTRTKNLRIRNSGGGVLRGSLQLGMPWSIEGPLDFALAEGAEQTFEVAFSPLGPEEQRARLSIEAAAAPSAFIGLSGEGVYRFDVAPRVSFGSGFATSTLEVPVSNLVDESLDLVIGAPPPLLCEPVLRIPPKGRVPLKIAVQKKHYPEKSVELTIRDGDAVCGVRVDLPAPPALLEWASRDGVVDLGDFALRHTARSELEIRNRGLTPASVELREQPGGLLLESDQPQSFELRPGESAMVRTVWRLPEVPGEFSSSLVASHGGLDHSLRIKARVLPEPVESSAEDQTRASAPGPAAEELRILTPAESEELRRRLPRDIGYRVIPRGSRAEALVMWKYSGTEPVEFRVERKVVQRTHSGLAQSLERRLQVPADLPVPESIITWVPVSGPENPVRQLPGGAWEASVPGLEAGYHQLRIVTRAPPDGTRSDHSSFTVGVDPLPPSPVWKWLAGGIGLLCFLFLMRKKIRALFGSGPAQN